MSQDEGTCKLENPKTDIDNDKDEPHFYNHGAEYWGKIEPTVDGMLGGLGHLTNIDIQHSEQFLKTLMKVKTRK